MMKTGPTVWRAKIHSLREDFHNDAQRDEARAYCRWVGVVRIGWGRWTLTAPDGALLENVLAEIRKIEGWKPGDPVRRLARDAKCGDLVWNRDSSGAYWLGRITGPWRFDGSDEASKWDLNNVRNCEWLTQTYRDWEVPGAVARSFTGRPPVFDDSLAAGLAGLQQAEVDATDNAAARRSSSVKLSSRY